MDNVIITEGELDKALILSLVGDLPNTKYIAAGGWSGADSLARSYLTDPNTRVVLVVDADSLDPNAIDERKRFLKRSLGQIAQDSRFLVMVVEPEIERLLFDSRAIIEGLIGHKVSDNDLAAGQFQPRSVLEKIAELPKAKLYERLSQIDLGSLKIRPEIASIRRFLAANRRQPSARSVPA